MTEGKTFHASPVEVKAAEAFIKEHGSHGQPGRMTFMSTSSITWGFTWASACTFVEVRCRCGATLDVTDVDSI